ncbi:DUF4159 domain-containing protein [Aestuariivirga litoralis]|uniref:DUF4159 domain-containing protein n=1 Tax=Aestuariivirga litoralis TaxID=2650924 RepID=UPI0018C7FDDD|nr:DUF4159 domain-containing protein [Aestuariivirga litoralis]MBG1230949.1 DUF4159 domain-containing protein [Aestuariivirga litoralis]
MSGFFQTLLFEQPLALWALLALPAIWWLLRTIPPRPKQLAFPPLRILLGLREKEQTSDTMPWWLLLLRLLIAALIILAIAHPFTRKSHVLSSGTGPLALVIDDSWAAAKDWPQRQDAALSILGEAPSRVIYLIGSSNPEAPTGINADDAAKRIRAWMPKALNGDRPKALDLFKGLNPAPSEIVWLTDGLDEGSASAFSAGLNAIATTQTVKLPLSPPPLALGQPKAARGEIQIDVLRGDGAENTATVQALSGDGRVLAEDKLTFDRALQKQAHIVLPVELRNAVQSLVIKDQYHAGAHALLDDSWRRKTVAIMSGASTDGDQPLLSSSHYLETALAATAELQPLQTSADLTAALDQGLSMLILDDIGALPQADHDAVAAWLDKGGLLVRFAGPRLAANADDLLPVKLREGDRNLGSSLSWETPQTIKPFAEISPLAGIEVDDKATISRQLLAEPDVDLTAKTWASLADGTPLITSAKRGQGRIVLFHVTANADWSNLPLSGSFEKIMQRLGELAPAAGDPKSGSAGAGTTEGDFAPHLLLTGTGDLASPTADVKSIAQKDIGAAVASSQTPAGLYARALQTRAVNLKIAPNDVAPMPATLDVKVLQTGDITSYATLIWAAAALLYLLDGLAALFLGGHLARKSAMLLLPLALLFLPTSPDTARAAGDEVAMQAAALQTRLAYVKTGEADVDQESDAGLKGLTAVVNLRTSAVLADPVSVDIETDELVFYPLLYWPVSAAASPPSAKALERIAAYMKNGGTIFFDLREPTSDFSNGGASEALRKILAGIDVPPLQPVPEGHALTKSFYLLKEFPGRYEGGNLWVETQDDPTTSGFDNVSGLLIGSNDYAAAWATDENGEPHYAMIPDAPRQQEFALRVGVNVVMYVLTGNYKTDQVHVPAILERLGRQ